MDRPGRDGCDRGAFSARDCEFVCTYVVMHVCRARPGTWVDAVLTFGQGWGGFLVREELLWSCWNDYLSLLRRTGGWFNRVVG